VPDPYAAPPANSEAGSPDRPAARPDPSVSRAFAVGWQMASLSCLASLDTDNESDERAELSSSSFTSARRAHQVKAGLHKLAHYLMAAGDQPIETEPLDRALEDDPATRAARVDGFHAEVTDALGAADFRLGKAYGLGHDLAETCLKPEDRASLDAAFGPRVVEIKNSLADLASTLPPHASRAVIISLRAWEGWAAEPRLDDKELDWALHGAAVRTALRRQGEVWRALLSQEKQGTDMLDTEHFLRAATTLVAEMTSTIWRFLRPVALPLAIAVGVLAAGIALLALAGGIAQILGAIAAILSAVGITGAGLRARLGRATAQLETRLWNAELDLAIAEAVLIGPEGWGVQISKDTAVPATGPTPKVSGNLETLEAFRNALAELPGARMINDRERNRLLEEIKPLLTSNAEFITEAGRRVNGRNAVARWLLEDPVTARRVGSEPKRVIAAAPGILVAYVEAGGDVWWVREGKVRRWRGCAGRAEARGFAGLAPGGD
jgi:hypothetical protein